MIRRMLLALAALLVLVPASAGAQVPTLQLGAAGGIALVPPGPITSDGSRITLTLVVNDVGGKLASGVRFKGSMSTVGRFDPECQQVGPGLYNCSFTAPDGTTQAGRLDIKARLESGVNLDASFPLEVTASRRGRVALNATPDRILLGQDPTSTLTITVQDKGGVGVDGADLVATANVGEVQALTPLTGGTWSAVYVPPTAPFPQVAILSVWDRKDPANAAFFTIPLIGKVNYPVDARAPGVTLVFKVGDQTFPPAVTDASGVARVPISVPPGIQYADVELIQQTGARSTQKIDLQVPPFNRIAVGGLPSFVPADGASTARVRVFVVDSKGRPADGQNVVVTATQGTVSPTRFVRDGMYEATFTAPRLDTSSRATVTAVISGEEGSSSDSIEVGLEPGIPDSISLTADPSSITPSVTKSTVTATIKEASGAPSETYKVEFRTAEGPLANPKKTAPGVFTADVAVAWNVKKVVSAIAGIRGNSRPLAGLVAFPLEDVVLTGQKMPVTIVALDVYGNPVANAPLNVSVLGGGGSVTTSVQTDDRGLGTVLYSAGPLAGLATLKIDGANGVTLQTPIWQSAEPVKGFAFPVSGGQEQGSRTARWRRLRTTVSLGADQEAQVTPPVAGGGVWGAGDGETTVVDKDTGSALPAGKAAKIEVSLVPSTVPETGGTVNLLVRVVDSGGILVPGEQVILLADGGTVSGKVNNGDGTTTALLTVPANLGKPEIQVTATRAAGDLAGFAKVAIGGQAAVAAKTPKEKTPKEKAPKEAPADGSERTKRRMAQVTVGWTPGAYRYDGTPCANVDEGDCNPVADSLLGGYDFLKVQSRAATLGSFQVKGEVFPIEYVGAAVSYTRLAYQTDFSTSGSGDAYCATHFCDGMNFLNIDAQGRLPLLKAKGPLDILARVGYMAQDVVMFRRVLDTTDNEKKPQFDTLTMHGLRAGLGVRFTAIPLLRPHVDYNATFGLGASFSGSSFGLTGVTNHNVNVGLSVLPWKGLLLDVSYDLLTRSLTLRYPNELDIAQRGRINEQAHTVRISAGWAF